MLDQEHQSGDQKGFDFLLLMIDSNVENEKKELMQNSKVPSLNNECRRRLRKPGVYL